jgi:hypothetical protein
MSLFSFTDINIANSLRTTDPAAIQLLADNDSAYAYKIQRYPIDIGAADKSHYMVIHVCKQIQSKYGGEVSGQYPTIYTNIASRNSSRLDGTNISSSLADNISTLARSIVRTEDTIVLHMPDTLNFGHSQDYETLNTNQSIAPLLGSMAGIAANDYLKDGVGVGTLKNYAPMIANYLAKESNLAKTLFAGVTGTVINPMMEIIYSSPRFREFQFDFMFYPRSEKEAYRLQNILETLRFHQAPEIKEESAGYLLIPPSEFDIKFYYNGVENPNIPKISTCVLSNINMDYAPNGFAAYETPNSTGPYLGGTGMPVAIRLTLSFTETELLTKKCYRNGN